MKNIFKNLSYLLFFILIFSCQNEDDQNIKKEREISLKILSFDELRANQRLVNKFDSLISTRTTNRNALDIYHNEEYGFTIDTDSVKYVESEDYHSYSFLITRDNPEDDKLENLFLSLNDEGLYDSYIVKYDFTLEEYQNVTINQLESRTTVYTPIAFDSSNVINRSSTSRTMDVFCVEYWIEIEVCGELKWVLFSQSCTSIGGGSSSGGVPPPNPTPSESGGGTSTSTNSSPFISAPVAPTFSEPADQQILDCFSSSGPVPETVTDWLDPNITPTTSHTQQQQVANFLNNNCNPESQNFAEQAMQSFNNNTLNVEIFQNTIELINSGLNYNNASDILNTLNSSNTTEVQLNNIINILESNFPSIISNNPLDYINEILRMTAWMKVRGNQSFGNYIESIVTDLPSSATLGDVINIYNVTKSQYNILQAHYMIAVFRPVAEASYPFIQLAIIEATLGVAIPILSKIPLAWVIRGSKLEAMIIKTTELGIQGTSSPFVRAIYGSSTTRAESLFSTLTKDAISITNPSSTGTIIANMGNGNFITFRLVSGTQSPGVIATIDYNFQLLLGTNSYKLKFYL